MTNEIITQKHLKELLSYDPETGLFAWAKKPCKNIAAGAPAGGKNKSNGYIIIMIAGVNYRAHRLAWFYVYGEWPKEQIDHINHIRDDNRITNLRCVTASENMMNISIKPQNTSGVTGVYINKKSKKWIAYITVNKKMKYLGSFSDFCNAVDARKAAEVEFGYHANHGL